MGIGVTVVLPGYFRTNFLESSSLRVPAHPIADYKLVRELQALHETSINETQPGDPDKAADVMIGVATRNDDPCIYSSVPTLTPLLCKKSARSKKISTTSKTQATATGF